jgi:hypothetical protein
MPKGERGDDEREASGSSDSWWDDRSSLITVFLQEWNIDAGDDGG